MSRRILTIVAIVVIVFAGGLSAVLINSSAGAFRAVSTTPHDTHSVSGNGGTAVAVGNYLYFIGNFVPTSSITYRQNEHNRVVVNERRHYGGIFRVPLAGGPGLSGQRWDEWATEFGVQQSARPIYDNTHLNKPYEDPIENARHFGDEWNTRIVGKELIVPKIAGFEHSAMWVFGDHIIYTSPHNRLDRRGNLQTGRIDFFRVDLNGRNHRRIYTTATTGLTRDNWAVAWGGGQSHLLVMDGSRLVHVGVSQNPGRVTQISEEATSFALPIVTSYFSESDLRDKGFGGVMGFVYWTENRTEEETNEMGIRGNLMKRMNLANFNRETIGNQPNQHYTVHSLSGGRLIFEISGIAGNPPYTPVLLVADRPGVGLFQPNQVFDQFKALGEEFDFSGLRFFSSTEFSAGGMPLFAQNPAGNIVRFTRQANGQFDFAGTIAYSAGEIIAVTRNSIVYMIGTQVYTIDHSGNPITTQDRHTRDMTSGSRISFFEALPHEPQSGLEFFIYFRTLTSNEFEMVPGEGEDEELVEAVRETKTVAVMVDSNGVEWILAIVEDEFITRN